MAFRAAALDVHGKLFLISSRTNRSVMETVPSKQRQNRQHLQDRATTDARRRSESGLQAFLSGSRIA
jgi:hypothetical protein